MRLFLLILLSAVSAEQLNCYSENWFYSSDGNIVISNSDVSFNATFYNDGEFVAICQNVKYCNMYAEKIDSLIMPQHNYSVLIVSHYCETHFSVNITFYENSSWFRILMLEFLYYVAISASAIMVAAILPICISLWLAKWTICTKIYIVVTYIIGILSCLLLCMTLLVVW